MPVQDIQKVLPAWNRTHSSDVAHLTNERLNREVAYCGCRRATKHSGHGFYPGDGKCKCGTPICPACLQVKQSYDRSGAWEGP